MAKFSNAISFQISHDIKTQTQKKTMQCHYLLNLCGRMFSYV